ncbi:MAG TPA: glycosyltransferase family 4 protein [Trinickia sp.]|uniref:glycosyltransferase family 4 protein n=1 Tax=Trinickia sp. TaxID=2571163 RepID=UPI002CCE07E9|nr:glycosyltransferase family 4 protein [Trinickia sp.]HTI17798.1 glycosyltransferase family 4 protein [Trinickia sp.]
MKLGISANALKHGGGFERYAMDLARGLAAHGQESPLAFFARKFDRSLPEFGLVEPHRISVSWLPGKWRDHWFSWRLRAARRGADVDVLIGCNRVDSSDIAICGGTHRGFLSATGRAPKRSDKWQIALESRQYARAAVVVAHSPQMRDELRTLYGVDDEKIRLLYPPVDSARFSPVDAAERARLRQRFGFADGEVVLLFPSSSHERKGLPFIEAVMRETRLPVVVAVAGRPPQRTSERIRYVGYVKEIEDCYRAADFTILASTYEPFGLVGIESIMCGTPVILAANVGCCDAIADQAKFVFAPGESGALHAVLAQAVASVQGGPEVDRARMAREAVAYDPRLAAHVEALVALASAVHGRTRGAAARRDA